MHGVPGSLCADFCDPLFCAGALSCKAENMEQNFLLFIAYKGTAYHGFQVQKNSLTVCEVFQDALQAVLGQRPDVKGCSRTDAGVHALEFGISFAADTRLAPGRLVLALNAHLPADVRALRGYCVPQGFHARYAAHTKTYHYRIRNSAVDSPFDGEYCCKIAQPQPLDIAAMNRAAALLVGKHDFMAFCSAGSKVAESGDTVRTITSCEVLRQGDCITIAVTADGYLYNMVRILAGTLVQVGAGKMQPDEMPGILQSRDRAKAGPTLPAKGLFLVKVDYGQEFEG